MRDAIISFPMFGAGFQLDPPYAVTIGGFSIYFYGIIIALGLLLAVLYHIRFSRRLDMKMDDVYDYLIWAIILAIIGARLYYVLFFYSLAELKADPLLVFRIRDGGLAIYGGVIGAGLALLIRSRMRHERVWAPLDVMGFGLLIGQCVGRWGNFFNREAYGAETDVFCRMGLTLNGSTIYVHPTFLYESLWNLLGLILMHLHCRKHRKYQGQYFWGYLFWYGLGRAFIEGLRADSLWLIPDVIRVSQLLAAVTAALGLAALLINARRLRAGKPPLLGAPVAAAAEPDHTEKTPEEENHT